MEKHGKHLAIDIGASGGRHMIAFTEGGKITLKEIYRFENEMTNKDGKLVWDLGRLFDEILNGMKKCCTEGLIPDSMAIDTWAVDYVLLDENDQVIGDTFGYRDGRTKDMDKAVYESVSEEKLYERTGIKEKYSSFSNTDLGKKIRNNTATLEELAAHACEIKKPNDPGSGRQEYLESVMNNILFS